MKYLSKNPWFEDITEIVDLPEQEITEPEDNIFELLSDSELDLLKNYYYGADKEKLASQNGLSVNALYSKVKRIKKRLKESQNQVSTPIVLWNTTREKHSVQMSRLPFLPHKM